MGWIITETFEDKFFAGWESTGAEISEDKQIKKHIYIYSKAKLQSKCDMTYETVWHINVI